LHKRIYLSSLENRFGSTEARSDEYWSLKVRALGPDAAEAVAAQRFNFEAYDL
jgi:hypothetical protein